MRGLAAPGLVLLLLLTGCLSIFDDGPDYDAIDRSVERDALDALEITETGGVVGGGSRNLDLVGYHNGFDDSGDATRIPDGGLYTELAVTAERAYLVRSSQGTSGEGTYGGFSILDIRDPTDPFLLGHYEAPSGGDIEINDDETLAFFGTQRNTVEEIAGRLVDTGDPTASLPRGVHVVDITNKREPTLAFYLPLPYNGVHTMEYVHHANGNEYLLVATYDLYTSTVPSSTLGAANGLFPVDEFPLTQRVLVFQIQQDDAGVALLPVSTYQVLRAPVTGELIFPHDTFVQVHPVTGQTLLYVAYWDDGVHVLDFTDPAAPVLLDQYENFDPSPYRAIHQVRAMPEPIGERHVTVTEPEIISGATTGQITFLDTTDPGRITKISHWQQPNPDIAVNHLDFSPHNFDILDGRVALSHYELGVWIIDASTEANVLDPKTTGFYLPADSGREGVARSYWTAFWQEREDVGRLVFAVDSASGLHVLHFTGP